MDRINICVIIFVTSLILVNCSSIPETIKTEKGVLRVSKVNPRYFADNTGKAIYLTGSHAWNNVVDMGQTDPPEKLNYTDHISWLKKLNHNFTRLWAWELLRWNTGQNKNKPPYNHYISIHPYMRTGPGLALDGKPKFDLSKINQEYLNVLHERIRIAGDSGIYVSVMLFEGWGNQFIKNSYETSPFHPKNNINGIVGDLNQDGIVLEVHQLTDSLITNIQRAYVKRVIETVNEFDNIIYEIGNEINVSSTAWQYEMIRFVKEYEKNMPRQHPVGMTYQHKLGNNQTLFDSPADWISPDDVKVYRYDPTPANGSKVILDDTDHFWGIGGNTQWVWKSFMRGLNPIFMDSYECKVLTTVWANPIRTVGYSWHMEKQIDLIHMPPKPGLSSTKYCLANEGTEYLVYLPDTVHVSIDLTGNAESFDFEWINPDNMESVVGTRVKGGGIIELISPLENKGVLAYLK